jgi:hypothetical protein
MTDDDERVERVAKACFGVWREFPPLTQAKIDTAWESMEPAFKTPWLAQARSAIKAAEQERAP